MVLEFGVNYWAVLLAAVLNFIIGALWYSPLLFMNTWIKLSGFSKKDMKCEKKGMFMGFISSFIGALILSFVIAVLFESLSLGGILNAIFVAVLVWLGFTAATSFTETIYSKRSKSLFFLNAGYQLVGVIVMAIVLVLL